MNHYETLRNDLAARLLEKYPAEQAKEILSDLDLVSVRYEVTRKSVDLIVLSGIPEIVKIYIAAKAIENRSKTTLDYYRRRLAGFFRDVPKPCAEITTNDIRTWLYWYKENHHVSDSSLNTIRSVIRGFFSWAADEEYIPRNPASRIGVIAHPEPERHAMTSLELETIRAVCKTVREKCLVDLFYSTACRVSEIAAMKLSDVDLENGTAVVRHGKGDKRRTVFLNAECRVSLRAYLASRSDPCDSLIVSLRQPAHPLTVKALQNEVARICARAGIQTHVTPHVFRHTTATVALRSGMAVDQVRLMLGHSKIDTTLIYAKTDEADVKASHARYVS